MPIMWCKDKHNGRGRIRDNQYKNPTASRVCLSWEMGALGCARRFYPSREPWVPLPCEVPPPVVTPPVMSLPARMTLRSSVTRERM